MTDSNKKAWTSDLSTETSGSSRIVATSPSARWWATASRISSGQRLRRAQGDGSW